MRRDSLTAVGPAGIEPTTSTVEARRFAPVTHIFTRQDVA